MQNDFLPFGVGAGANVLSQTDYAALAARSTGFQAGVAKSVELNKAWRQSAVMAAMIGQFINDVGGYDALDDGNVTSLLTSFERSIQSGKLNFAVAGGSANALTATLAPEVDSLHNGLVLYLLVDSTNTGAATLNVDGLGNKAVKTLNGSALLPGDIYPGLHIVAYSEAMSAFVLLTPPVRATNTEARDATITNRYLTPANLGYVLGSLFSFTSLVLYVRTDGSDSHDGSANTAASAFATVQGAIDWAQTTYGLTRRMDIRIGLAGTYAAPNRLPRGSDITITGDLANPQNYILSASTGQSVMTTYWSSLQCFGLTFSAGAAGMNHILASQLSNIQLTNCRYVSTGMAADIIYSAYGSVVSLNGTQTVLCSGRSFLDATLMGHVTVGDDVAVTFSGSPSYSVATVIAEQLSRLRLSPSATLSGSVTGTRFKVSENALIYTSGAGVNFVPGTVAGTQATGGQYV